MSTNEIKKKVNEDSEDNILTEHPLLLKSEKVHDFRGQTKGNICQNLLFRGNYIYKKDRQTGHHISHQSWHRSE